MAATLLSAVAEHATRMPDKDAVVVGKDIISYGELWGCVVAASRYLEAAGAHRGDAIVLSAASSSPSFAIGYLGCHLLGCVAVPVDPQTPSARLQYIIDKTRSRLVFLARPTLTTDAHKLDELARLKPVSSDDLELPRAEERADILFTTGTTGEPKGVVLTHKNILSAATNINEFIGNTKDDRELVPLPLSHSFGLGRLRCNLLAGGTLVLVGGFTFPGQIFRAIEHSEVTGFASVPAGIQALLHATGDRLGRYADQLLYLELGSAPMPLESKQRLMALLPNSRICMHYGLTEASRATFLEFHTCAHKLDSVGKPTPNVEMRIVDDDGCELPQNQSGKIMVKGDMVASQYLSDSSLTQRSMRSLEGWFYTGDIGHLDDEGYLHLEVREKEMINLGGRKVSPIEIERLLIDHEAIADCVCVGIPDPKGITGEAIKVFVVAKETQCLPSADQLTNFLRGKLEPYKLPIEYEWIKTIPKTSSGKVQRLSLVR